MLKVLVADQNTSANSNCCKYLANDKKLSILSACSGIGTVTKYNGVHPNILVLNYDFNDKSCLEIINEISSTTEERHNCNIILTVKDEARKLELDFMAKVYKLIYSNTIDYSEIKLGIEQYYIDNVLFYEPNDDNLMTLFLKFDLINMQLGSVYLRFAIKKCYENPKLMNSLKDIYSLTSKEFEVSFDSVRPAIRNSLKRANRFRNKCGNTSVLKLFENEDFITPKNFIRIITSYYLKRKK